MLRAIFIVACLAVASPSFAQQVRVITGDIEHIYGPGGEILDDAELRARNERAFEKMQLEKQRAIEKQQIEAENERLRLERDQTALAYASARHGTQHTAAGFSLITIIGSTRE